MRKFVFAALAALMMLPAAAEAKDRHNRDWDRYHGRGHHYGWDRDRDVVIVERGPRYSPYYYDCGGYYARSCVRPHYYPSRTYITPAPTFSFGVNVR